MSSDLFSTVKSAVKVSDYVKTLPQTSGLHSVGPGRWRCNNVVAGGDNPEAMIIDDDAGSFKIFSHDQQSGDVVTLYSLVNSITSFAEAARDLARDMGVAVPEASSNTPSLHKVMNAIADSAHSRLVSSNSDEAKAAREYLRDRGMTDDIRDEWRLGVIPSDSKQARAMLTSCGDAESLRKCGMYSGKSGDFIAMAGRLTFPIMSTSGSCISFSSRVIPGVHTVMDSKYVNTRSTPIYSKHDTLYGQHLLRGKKISRVIICEGNLDVMALNAITDDSVVALATCGTALTDGHIGIIIRHTRNAALMFDSDAAGRKAAANSLWVCNHLDSPRIALLDGKDPWDCYIDGDLSSVKTAPMIDQAVSFMSQDLSRHDFLDWYSRARSSLNFTEDRDRLEKVAAEKGGINRSALPGGSGSSVSRTPAVVIPEGEVSEVSKVLCRALLCLSSAQRRAVAFPMLSPRMRDAAFEICGMDSESDRALISSVIEGGEHPVISDLLPSRDDDSYRDMLCGDTARLLAMRVLEEWRRSTPPGAERYISTVSITAASGCTLDHLLFIFDMIGYSSR